MPFDGNGLFTVFTPGNPVVSGTTISSTAFNATTADFAAGLTNTLTKDGQTPATANIPLGGNKLTGVGNGTARTDALNVGQAQDSAITLITGVSGTNTIVGNITPALSAYVAGQTYRFVAVGANTTGVTLNIDAKGAKAVTKNGVPLASGDIQSGVLVTVTYDGTNFQLSGGVGAFATLSSAADITVGNSVSVGSGGGFIPLNVRFGQLAMANNATGFSITALGAFAANGGTAASNTTAIGYNSLLAATGVGNLAAGSGSGSAITTGTKNSIFGSFTGNQGGYDIRTSSNNLVLSDGDGNVKLFADASGRTLLGTTAAGIGNNANTVLTVGGNTTTTYQSIKASGGAELILLAGAGETSFGSYSNDFLTLRTNNTERLRIDAAGNVGIGGAPSYKFDLNVVGGGAAASRIYGSDQANVRLRLENAGSGGRTWEIVGGLPGANNANFSLRDVTGGTTPLTIDAAGNAGLGVVPSAWGAGFKALDVGGAFGLNASIGATSFSLAQNAFFNGTNWIYKNTNFAARYDQLDGVHQWSTAPSGTAGNAITFTQSLAFGKGTTLALEGATSAAGTGIAFPATQLASSNANTFDDFERGNWSPTAGAGLTVVGTFSFANCKYVKKANEVTVTGQLIGSTSVACAAAATIFGGLPFATGGLSNGVIGNSTTTAGGAMAVSGTSGFSYVAIAATPSMYFTVTYFV